MTVRPDTQHDDLQSANEALLLWLAEELARRAPKSASPEEIARACLAEQPELAMRILGSPVLAADWRKLLPHIRRAALDLASKGRIELLRKGRSVEPASLKGVYRLRAKGLLQSADSKS